MRAAVMTRERHLAIPLSAALHACVVILIAALARHEVVRPLQGTEAITVHVVTLAQMQAALTTPKQEAKPPAPPVTHSETAMPKKQPVAQSKPKLQPQPQAKAASSVPEQQAQEAKNDTHGATVLYQPMPNIPDDLRAEAFSTYAVARFRIAPDGSTTVELLAPSQNPRLNRLLLDALHTWRFAPATDGGHPIASTFDIRVRFAVE